MQLQFKRKSNLKDGLMFSIKKLLSISLFVPTLAFASAVGVGEYRFGPDTAENSACEFAEHRAREDAILQFFGEQFESITMQECKDDDCEFHNQIFSEVKGIVKKIINRQRQIIKEEGYKNCIVSIEAEVEKIKNDIRFDVHTKTSFLEGQHVYFSFVTNRSGTVLVYSYDNGYYYALDRSKIQQQKELTLPNDKRVVASLRPNQYQAKDLLAFVFTEQNVEFKSKYTANEMRNMLASLDATKKRVVYRYVTIVRNI